MSKNKVQDLVKLQRFNDKFTKKQLVLNGDMVTINLKLQKELASEKKGKKGKILNSEYYTKKLNEKTNELKKTQQNQSEIDRAIKARSDLVNKNIRQFKALIEHAENAVNNKNTKKSLEEWQKKLFAFQKELDSYNKLTKKQEETIKKTQEKQAEKIEKLQTKAQEKKQKKAKAKVLTYDNYRDKLFDAVSNLVSDSENINKVLDNVIEGKKLQTVLSGAKFVGKNAGSGLKLLSSAPFFKKEGERLIDIFNGKKKLNNKNLPFFLKLLQDKKAQEFLKKNGQNIDILISSIAPKIAEIALANLGDLEKINKEIQSKAKEFKKLPEIEQNIALLMTNEFSKDNNKQIKELEQQIAPLKELQNKKQIAQTISDLKLQKIDTKYLSKMIMPVINDVTHELLVDNPADLADIIKLSGDMAFEKNVVKKNQILGKILGKIDVAKLVTSDHLINFLSQENSKDLTKIANTVIKNNKNLQQRMDNFGIDKTLIKDAVPLAAKIGNRVLSNPKIDNVVKVAKNIIIDGKLNPNNITPIVSAVSDFITETKMLDVIKNDVPDFLGTHKNMFGNIVSKSVPQALKTMQTDKLPVQILNDVKPDFYKNAVEAFIPLVGDVLKSATNEQINKIVADTQILAKPTLNEMSGLQLDNLKEQKANSLNNIVNEGLKIVSNSKVTGGIAKNVGGLLGQKDFQNGVVQIIGNAQKNIPAVERLGLEDKLVKNAVPIVSNLGSALASRTKDVVGLYNKLSNIVGKDLEVDETRKQAYEMIDHANNIIGFPVGLHLNVHVPNFLRNNEKEIVKTVGNFFEKNQDFAKASFGMGIDKEFAQDLTNAATSIAADMLPEVVSLAGSLLKDKKNAVNIFEQIGKLAKADDKATKIASGSALASTIYTTISKNPNLKKIINTKLPEILDRNNAKFGAILDKLMVKTKIGRNLTIKGSEILRTVQVKTPQINQLLSDINKGKIGNIVFSAAKLLIDPKMLTVTSQLIGDAARYIYQKNFVTNTKRRKECNVEVNGAFADITKNLPKIKKGEKLPDLGKLLESKVNLEQKNSLQYLLKNHDMRGLELHQNPLDLNNFKINDFNFKDVKFKGEVSFAGSNLKKCSFKNAKFEQGVSFDGATIDSKTLESLLPAIRKHNAKNVENKITLDNIKITGDVAKLNMKDVSMKNVEVIKSKKALKEEVQNIVNKQKLSAYKSQNKLDNKMVSGKRPKKVEGRVK